MTFLSNKECDIPGNTLMHTQQACFEGWVLNGYGISLFYFGKVMEFKHSEGAQTLCKVPWAKTGTA